MGRQKKYFTEEERKEAKKMWKAKWRAKNPDYNKKWRAKNPESDKKSKTKWEEKNPDYKKEWREKNKEAIADYQKEYQKEYNKTPMGRASYLVKNYKKADKLQNRGECTLTARWVADNIFPKPCRYCGVTGWEIIGCDRIDNDLPHTPYNVVPCCEKCNNKRGTKSYEEFLKENNIVVTEVVET